MSRRQQGKVYNISVHTRVCKVLSFCERGKAKMGSVRSPDPGLVRYRDLGPYRASMLTSWTDPDGCLLCHPHECRTLKCPQSPLFGPRIQLSFVQPF